MGISKPTGESSLTVDSLIRRGNTMFYALNTLVRKQQKQCGRKFETKTSSDGREGTTDVDCLCCKNERCACAGVRAMFVWQGYESNWDESDAKPEVKGPMTPEERDAIDGMAFALDYVAKSVRARPSGCSGDFKLGRRPLTHRDCVECGGNGLCIGYQAAAALVKHRKARRAEVSTND